MSQNNIIIMSNINRIINYQKYNKIIWHWVGSILIFIIPYVAINSRLVDSIQRIDLFPMTVGSILTYLTTVIIIERLIYYPGEESTICVVPTAILTFSIFSIFLLSGFYYYSRAYLIIAFLISINWIFLGIYLSKKLYQPHFILLSENYANPLKELDNIRWTAIEDTDLEKDYINGVVVDCNHHQLERWQPALIQCATKMIPIYDASNILEALKGKIALENMSELQVLQSIQLGLVYPAIKKTLDIVLIILSLPLILPIMAMTALLIRLDSKGPIFFIQERIGQGNKIFRMVKFRSMSVNGASKTEFTRLTDTRITRLGLFLRKYRIDELPQFWNILKGEMSLIGPRPEQPHYVKAYQNDIQYYNYRHIVKPGITGWAQVFHGYTDSTSSTRDKVAHDFYYLKHLSFWFDLYIIYKTIKTILTGFGSR